MGGERPRSGPRRTDAERFPVLVVEDDAGTRELLAREIGDAGYPVRAVPDGPAALAAVAEQPAAIVVADIRLPGGTDGVRLCATIRETHPETEVILVTAFASISTAIDGVKLGACDYLLKPFEDLADIQWSLARAAARVAQRRAERELTAGLRLRAQGQEALLDRLPTAIFISDAGRNVHGRNRAAELLLSDGAGLRLDPRGQVRCVNEADDACFGAALAACCAGQGEAAAVAISRRPGAPPLRAVVAALREGALAGSPRTALAAVLVGAPGRIGILPDAEILARLYGLTPAEGALAARLVAGESVQEACDSLGIALATARTHLSRIFSKTGTSRQADLVGLVLTGPALLAAGVETVGQRS